MKTTPSTSDIVHSRLAPTPSGFLHLGNIYHFILTWLLTRREDGTLRLRIDDIDSARVRPEYLADIFHVIDRLGLDYDSGPSGPDDFEKHHSQRLRLDLYRKWLREKQRQHGSCFFPCACSRREIREQSADGLHHGVCQPAPREETALRVQVPPGTVIDVEGRAVDLYHEMGDTVIWRKDGLPAYQLVSLYEDTHDGTTLIVRGDDLRPSTATQLYLARLLDCRRFTRCRFHHHKLLYENNRRKLSKSAGAGAASLMTSDLKIADIFLGFSRFAGLPEPVSSAKELLSLPAAQYVMT